MAIPMEEEAIRASIFQWIKSQNSIGQTMIHMEVVPDLN